MSKADERRRKARARFRKRVRASLARTDQAFRGQYKDEIQALSGLSREELEAISPDAADMVVYNKLIEVVKEASRTNLKQADLRDRIVALGTLAVEMARKVPSLATLLPL